MNPASCHPGEKNVPPFISHPNINTIYNEMIHLTMSPLAEVDADASMMPFQKIDPSSTRRRHDTTKSTKQIKKKKGGAPSRRRSIDCSDLLSHLPAITTEKEPGVLSRPKENSFRQEQRIQDILHRDVAASPVGAKSPKPKSSNRSKQEQHGDKPTAPDPPSAEELLQKTQHEGQNHSDKPRNERLPGPAKSPPVQNDKIPFPIIMDANRRTPMMESPRIRLRRHSMEGSMGPFQALLQMQREQQQQHSCKKDERRRRSQPSSLLFRRKNCAEDIGRDADDAHGGYTKHELSFHTETSDPSSSAISDLSMEIARHKVAAMKMQANKVNSYPPPQRQSKNYGYPGYCPTQAPPPSLASKQQGPQKSSRRAPPKKQEVGSSPFSTSDDGSTRSSSRRKKVPPPPPPPLPKHKKMMASPPQRRRRRRHSMSDCNVPPAVAATATFYRQSPQLNLNQADAARQAKNPPQELGTSGKKNAIPKEGARNNKTPSTPKRGQAHRRPKFIAPRTSEDAEGGPTTAATQTGGCDASIDWSAASSSPRTEGPSPCSGWERLRRHSMSDYYGIVPPPHNFFPRLPFMNDHSIARGGEEDTTAGFAAGASAFDRPGQNNSPSTKNPQWQMINSSNNDDDDVDYFKWDAAMERFQREHDEKNHNPTSRRGQKDIWKGLLSAQQQTQMDSVNVAARRTFGQQHPHQSLRPATVDADRMRTRDRSNATRSTKSPTESSENARSHSQDVVNNKQSLAGPFEIYTSTSLDDSVSSLENSMRSMISWYSPKESPAVEDVGPDYAAGMSLGSLENSMHHCSSIREDKRHYGHGPFADGRQDCSPTASSPTGVEDFIDESAAHHHPIKHKAAVPPPQRRTRRGSGGIHQMPPQMPPPPNTMEERGGSNVRQADTNTVDHDLLTERNVYEKFRQMETEAFLLKANTKEEQAGGGNNGLWKRMRRLSFCDDTNHYNESKRGIACNTINKDVRKTAHSYFDARRDSAERRHGASSQAKSSKTPADHSSRSEEVLDDLHPSNDYVRQMLQEHDEFLTNVQVRYDNIGKEKGVSHRDSNNASSSFPKAPLTPSSSKSSGSNGRQHAQRYSSTEEENEHYTNLLKKVWYQPRRGRADR